MPTATVEEAQIFNRCSAFVDHESLKANWQAQLEHGDAPDVPAEFNGNAAVTPREHQPTFAEYAKHLQSVAPFSSHASLHFALKSMRDIAGGLSTVGFAVTQSPTEEPLCGYVY
jgi:hypothetical protein